MIRGQKKQTDDKNETVEGTSYKSGAMLFQSDNGVYFGLEVHITLIFHFCFF